APERAARGLKVDYRTVGTFVRGEGLSFKKNRSAKRARPAGHRPQAGALEAYQGRIDPRRLVFIDETWAKTNMAPLRGWGLRGKRLKANAAYGFSPSAQLIGSGGLKRRITPLGRALRRSSRDTLPFAR